MTITLNTIHSTAVETNNGTITEYDPEFVEYSLLASVFFTPVFGKLKVDHPAINWQSKS